MYIWDAMYGKTEFDSLVYKCMLSPEMQRLREVRLCNINSLCITGSANTNRFEHSVGTAYLARLNIESEVQRKLGLTRRQKENFVLAALLHDVANGPFGHSYEYIMEKKGFIPEQGLKDVFTDVISVGSGAHKNTSPFETIYFGKLRALTSILNPQQKEEICKIIAGQHNLSKLICDDIDLDNIDNVFRMAYHMGLSFRREAPVRLAESMYIDEGEVVFLENVKIYLDEWYYTREKVYKFLLLNPQEFAGKYMLTEAMDILFECVNQNINREQDIKWNYTDYQLMEVISGLKEVWIKRKSLLLETKSTEIQKIRNTSSEIERKAALKSYLENLVLSIPIKNMGRSGEASKILLSDNFQYEFEANGDCKIINRNMTFEITSTGLYKVINVRYNPAQIVSRLMTGDLYYCLTILSTDDIMKYKEFLEYESRIIIEDEVESRIRATKHFPKMIIGIHPILDVNKTERQLSVKLSDSNKPVTIGEYSSKSLLLGVFIKNEPYGLKNMKELLPQKQKELIDIIINYFNELFDTGVKSVRLYEEADRYGK